MQLVSQAGLLAGFCVDGVAGVGREGDARVGFR